MKIKQFPILLLVTISMLISSSLKAQEYYDILTIDKSEIEKAIFDLTHSNATYFMFTSTVGNNGHRVLSGEAYDDQGMSVPHTHKMIFKIKGTGNFKYTLISEMYYNVSLDTLKLLDNYDHVLLTPYTYTSNLDHKQYVHYKVQLVATNGQSITPMTVDGRPGTTDFYLDPTPPYSGSYLMMNKHVKLIKSVQHKKTSVTKHP